MVSHYDKTSLSYFDYQKDPLMGVGGTSCLIVSTGLITNDLSQVTLNELVLVTKENRLKKKMDQGLRTIIVYRKFGYKP